MSAGAAESNTILGNMALSISDSGVSVNGPRHRFECSWTAVSDIIETPNLLLFVTEPANAIIVPRASIPDEDREALLAFSRERISG